MADRYPPLAFICFCRLRRQLIKNNLLLAAGQRIVPWTVYNRLNLFNRLEIRPQQENEGGKALAITNPYLFQNKCEKRML